MRSALPAQFCNRWVINNMVIGQVGAIYIYIYVCIYIYICMYMLGPIWDRYGLYC